MPKDNKLAKDLENAARFPGKALNTGGEFITTGKVTPDPTGKRKFTQAELDAFGKLGKARPRRPQSSTALSRAITGAGRTVNDFAEGFDRRSTALGEDIRAALKRKRPKTDKAPELRE